MLKAVILINLCYYFLTRQTVVLNFPTPLSLTYNSKLKKLDLCLIKVDLLKVFGFVCFFSSGLFFLLYVHILMLIHGDVERNPGPLETLNSIHTKCKKWPMQLKIVHANCQSIQKKQLQLKSLLNDIGPNCIYGLTETWLTSIDSNSFYNPNPYQFDIHRCDRQDKKGGGLLLLVPKFCNSKIRKDLNNMSKIFESLRVECKLSSHKSILINISYNPNKQFCSQFLDELALCIDKASTENKSICLIGDYNINYLNNKEKQKLDTIILPYDLHLMNSRTATRHQNGSCSLLDYIITDNGLRGKYYYVFDSPIISDHLAQILFTDFTLTQKQKPLRKLIFDKRNYDPHKFRNSLNYINWSLIYESNDIEEMFSRFESLIANVIRLHAPIRKIFIRNNKPNFSLADKFVTNATKCLNKKRNEFLLSENFDNFLKLKDLTSKEYLKDYERFQTQLIESANSSRKQWNLINEVRNISRTGTKILSLKNCFEDVITDSKKIANLLNYKFSKLGEFLLNKPTIKQNFQQINPNLFSFRFFTTFECRKALNNLNKNKPLGPSTIPAWALKDGAHILAEPLCFLFNGFLKQNKFPSLLKLANITPIHKKGDTENPLNYRPISITPALSKVLEILIKDQIEEHLSKYNLLSKTQFGFRKKFSTIDALVYLTETVRQKLDEKKVVPAAFLDLSKAFDSIDHSVLLEKLKHLGFSSSAILFIKSYLTNRHQRVVIPEAESDWLEVRQGVPQGTVLGPLLFNLYVNDLPNFINCSLIQYADDAVVYTFGKKITDCKLHLEKSISSLVDYFSYHSLKLNSEKTEFIVFGTSSAAESIKVDNHIIKEVDNVKYLGVILDKKLMYQQQVKQILSKMAQGIKTLYVLRNVVPYHLRKILLNSLVISHLQYSAVLLSSISKNLLTTLEKQLNWAVKACYVQRFNSSSLSIKLDNYILPIKQLLEYRTAMYVNQLLTFKKPAFRRITGLSLPTYKFYRHSRTKTIFLKRGQKHHGWTKVLSEKAYQLIIVLKNT